MPKIDPPTNLVALLYSFGYFPLLYSFGYFPLVGGKRMETTQIQFWQRIPSNDDLVCCDDIWGMARVRKLLTT